MSCFARDRGAYPGTHLSWPTAADTQLPRPGLQDRRVTGPQRHSPRSHRRLLLPKTTESKLSPAKERRDRPQGCGALAAPGPRAVVTCGHLGSSTRPPSRPASPPTPSSPFSSPGAPLKPGSLLSVCSISRAWTWPWNFTSLGGTGVLALSSAPPGPLSSASGGLGGAGSPVWQQGRLREAFQRAPNAGKRKSVTSVIPRLEYMRGFS